MTPIWILRGALAGVAALLLSGAAQAALFRAYVASTGNDANPCTLAAPCRLLPAALAAVNDGGEIWMLDSANYNTASVAIDKSVTILAVPGALGSVLAIGGNAINIAAPGGKVALRNLVITPLPGSGSTNGVRVNGALALTIDNCLIANMPGAGVIVATNASVRITDTTIRDSGSSGLEVWSSAHATVTRATISGNGGPGIAVTGILGPGTSSADIIDSTLDGNGYGVFAWAVSSASHVAKASIRDSRIVRNSNYGLLVQNDGLSATLAASNNVIAGNGTGIAAINPGARIWASRNAVSNNNRGFDNQTFTPGLFESVGNNAVRDNSIADSVGTITIVPPK